MESANKFYITEVTRVCTIEKQGKISDNPSVCIIHEISDRRLILKPDHIEQIIIDVSDLYWEILHLFYLTRNITLLLNHGIYLLGFIIL